MLLFEIRMVYYILKKMFESTLFNVIVNKKVVCTKDFEEVLFISFIQTDHEFLND